MKKLASLTVLTSLLWCAAAHAGGPPPKCYPWNSTSTALDQSTQPANLAKWLFVEGERASFVVTYFCDNKYSWQSVWIYGYRSQLPLDWQGILAQLPAMTKAQVDGLWNQSIPDADPELEAISKRQLDATRPRPIVWLTKPNSGNTQRPAYGLKADGTRDPKGLADRVAIGATCSCTTRAIEEVLPGQEVATYCSVSGQINASTGKPLVANRVSLCERQP